MNKSRTSYLNVPSEVCMYNTVPTRPARRGRKTMSKVVDSPGRTTYANTNIIACPKTAVGLLNADL